MSYDSADPPFFHDPTHPVGRRLYAASQAIPAAGWVAPIAGLAWLIGFMVYAPAGSITGHAALDLLALVLILAGAMGPTLTGLLIGDMANETPCYNCQTLQRRSFNYCAVCGEPVLPNFEELVDDA